MTASDIEQPKMSRAADNDVLVELHDVTKNYHTGEVEVPVLRGIDLDIKAGEVLVLVGPSGSGKSTLLNIIGGIDSITLGELIFAGEEAADWSEAKRTEYRRAQVGFVFQFYNLVPTLTAKENVEVAARLSVDRLDTEEALKLVGLEHRMDHFPSQLSGGEQQRVAIARAIAKKPRLLLCDEPTGALDLETGRDVLDVLMELNRRMGCTILIITHNNALSAIAHRTARIGSGTITDVSENSAPVAASEVTW
ncbi:ABC transporter ATP-binding protein [Calycomorphotria hydatis]|uniref:Lipoprotein-releasing system ATP-binding protein LolD n=1 Tax=Calycomorphotria hydatis TaxID=2528027 RepID=A0A517T9N4_9PLAN|nr:ABC transporter ATP-binding protein [Calycomorphotria hydatis]QDT65083.1 Lipoprotein-releasing system ATP-binding protein LolD [Calycomorphotria hydatis]